MRKPPKKSPPPARNERTSKRVAKIAARILHFTGADDTNAGLFIAMGDLGGGLVKLWRVLTIGELRALAASALTQAPDQKER